MDISTSVSITALQLDPSGGVAAPLLIVTEIARDRLLYDSGQATSATSATIPVNGFAEEGAVVEVRALSTDDGGATCGDWVELPPVGPSGAWSGSINARRNASWYRIEARLKAQPAIRATSYNRFGVGHVIAIWGQSEVALFWQSSHSNTPVETLTTKFGLLRLKDKSGRKSSAALKIPGVDAPPVGSSISGDVVTLNGLSGVVIADWDFRQKTLALANCADVTLRNCLFGGHPLLGSRPGILMCMPTASGSSLSVATLPGRPGTVESQPFFAGRPGQAQRHRRRVPTSVTVDSMV